MNTSQLTAELITYGAIIAAAIIAATGLGLLAIRLHFYHLAQKHGFWWPLSLLWRRKRGSGVLFATVADTVERLGPPRPAWTSDVEAFDALKDHAILHQSYTIACILRDIAQAMRSGDANLSDVSQALARLCFKKSPQPPYKPGGTVPRGRPVTAEELEHLRDKLAAHIDQFDQVAGDLGDRVARLEHQVNGKSHRSKDAMVDNFRALSLHSSLCARLTQPPHFPDFSGTHHKPAWLTALDKPPTPGDWGDEGHQRAYRDHGWVRFFPSRLACSDLNGGWGHTRVDEEMCEGDERLSDAEALAIWATKPR